MTFEEIRARAKGRASRPEGLVSDPELLRVELSRFFSALPEPPVYRRRDDPARPTAQRLLEEGEALLAASYALAAPPLALHTLALEAHVEALAAVAEGRPEAAEVPWRRAEALEAKALEGLRLWRQTGAPLGPAYDRAAGRSRYDPQEESRFEAKLICPGCRKVADYAVSPNHAEHALTCPSCQAPFTAYLGALTDVQLRRRGRVRHYALKLAALGGVPAQLEFEDGSGVELQLGVKDRVAFLYRPAGTLRAVLDLSTSRVLWVQEPGACFLATAALGPDAPELAVFRALRDRTLQRSRGGRAAVRAYYRWSPELVAALSSTPRARAAVRRALQRFAVVLRRAGYDR